MAISECDEHIEVRIKRPPADSLSTYFDEYVDSKTLGGPNDKGCESYIVAGEHDAQYLIEVILKPGFIRYGANCVHVQVWLGAMPGQSYHIALPPIGKGGLQVEKLLHIQRWRVTEDGVKMLKKLAFSRLETAPGLESETTVLGLDPAALGIIQIEIQRSISLLMAPNLVLSQFREHRRSRARKKASRQKTGGSPDGAQKALIVDEKLGKPENGGITHSTIFLDEGSRRRLRRGQWWSKDATPPQDRVGVVKFVFKYRTQGVLEALGIIRKPPPLWEWAWDDLTIVDRPKAFKQLQKDNKAYEMKEWEMKIRTGVEDQEPPEWKVYSKIHNRDKKRLFEVLQEKNKAYTRRDGRRDVKVSVRQLEYEQGPEGWEKHGDTHAISVKKHKQPIDVGKGFDDIEPFATTKETEQAQTRTANHPAAASPFSAPPAELVVEQTPSNTHQLINVHKRNRERSHLVKNEPTVKAEVVHAIPMQDISAHKPTANAQAEIDIAGKEASLIQLLNVPRNKRYSDYIKHESNVTSKLDDKPEPSTATTMDDVQDQGLPSKRRKISNTTTQSAQTGNHSRLFSTTIDITGAVPVVESKAAITIDLTAEPFPLVKNEELDDSNTSILPGPVRIKAEPSPAAPTMSQSTNLKSKSSHSTDTRGTLLVPIKAEPMTSSDTTVDTANQSSISSAESVKPTPTEAAERGQCLIM